MRLRKSPAPSTRAKGAARQARGRGEYKSESAPCILYLMSVASTFLSSLWKR